MNFSFYFVKDDGRGFNPHVIYEKIFDKIKIKYPEHSFDFIDNSHLRNHFIKAPNWVGPCNLYGDLFLRIQNEKNGKYFLVSYWDINRNIYEKDCESGFIVENLVELFTSTGIQKDKDYDYQLCDPSIKYTPISYCHNLIETEKEIEKITYKKINKTTPDKPKFRGFCYGIREYLLKDPRYEIIDTRVNKLSTKDYLLEINSNKINISFNGIGEPSHRDIDILGLGNVLLRTKMITDFHNPLIPEYHYASVEINDQSNFKDLADAFLEKYNKIKHDKDYLNFISSNGRRWYLENGTCEKNAEIITKLINLKKIQ